jgi:hypothetical protein
VQQVEVDVVEAEPAEAGVEADLRGVVAVVADPKLGGDEDLVAVDAGAAVPSPTSRSLRTLCAAQRTRNSSLRVDSSPMRS